MKGFLRFFIEIFAPLLFSFFKLRRLLVKGIFIQLAFIEVWSLVKAVQYFKPVIELGPAAIQILAEHALVVISYVLIRILSEHCLRIIVDKRLVARIMKQNRLVLCSLKPLRSCVR